MRNEIRIVGFGGQGVITIGILLAKAAGEFNGRHVAQSQSYGAEARGGSAKTEVVLSDEPIDYIKPLALNAILAMNQPAFDLYSQDLSDDAFVLVDTTMVKDIPERFTRVHGIAATEIAEALNLKVAANIVMFGALAKLTSWVTRDACEEVLRENMPERWIQKNLEAFVLGYETFATESEQN